MFGMTAAPALAIYHYQPMHASPNLRNGKEIIVKVNDRGPLR